jgi:hypothetical protein
MDEVGDDHMKDTVDDPIQLRAFNEIQHQVLPKIISHRNPAKWSLNDSDLLEVIREKAEGGDIVASVTWAIVDAEKKAVEMTDGSKSVM